MKKNVKRNLLTISATFFCVALGGLCALNAETAVAEANAEDFALQAGARVRISDDNVSGIRFSANVRESYIASLSQNGEKVEYLTLVAPSKNVDDITKLTVETRETYDAVSIISTATPSFTDENVDETFTYHATITYDNTELTEAQLLRAYEVALVARPFIAVTNQNGEQSYIYADTSASEARSMRQVANLALEDMTKGNQIVESKLTEAQFDSLLNYCEVTDSKAVLEADATSVEFIDGAKYNDAKVYMKEMDEEKGVVLTQVGTVSDKKLDVSGATLDDTLTVGETESLFLVNGDGVLVSDYRKITQVIDKAEELRIFDQGAYTNGYALVEGYYVLGCNIVDTEYEYNKMVLSSYATEIKDQGKLWYADYGFKGTFDGMGHYVTITTGVGLFNQILPMDLSTGEYSVIKNVAFKDCKITTSNNGSGVGAYASSGILGHGGNLYNISTYQSARDKLLVEVSNVYISMGADYFNKPRHDNYGSLTNALISDDVNNVGYKNVVVELADPPTTHTASPNLFRVSSASAMMDERFSNVYMIGKTTDENAYGDTTAVTGKEFTSQLKWSRVLSDLDRNASGGATTTPPTTIGLYKDNTAWKTAVTDLNARFANDCWTMQDGVPVWSAFIDNSVKITENIVFSGWTGTGVDNDEVKDQTIISDEIEGTISAVYLVSDIMKENNLYNSATGKVALTNDTNEAVEQEVYILTNKAQYRATLEIYTRVLTSAEDLRMFNQTDSDYKAITGSYALGADIVDTEFIYNEWALSSIYTTLGWHTYGFGGTFDGKGHSITYTCRYGLFNQFNVGAVVKNVAFNNIVLSGTGNNVNGSVLGNGTNLGTYTVANSGYNGYNDICVSISDVYISVGESWFGRTASRGYGAQDINKDGDKEDTIDEVYESETNVYKGATNATGILPGTCSSIDYKNVVIEINAPTSFYYAPDLFRDGFYNADGTHEAGFENVYVISKTVGALSEEGLGIVGQTGVENTTNFYSWYANNNHYWNPPTTVGFYKSWEDVTDDLSNKFTSGYWTVENGALVWTALVEQVEQA